MTRDATTSSMAVPSPRLRDDRDFVRYWAARQVSVLGSLVTAVVMPVLIYRLTGSPALTALTTLLEGLPYVLFGLFSGALSDRLDRRRVMVTADLACAAVIGSIPLAYLLGALTIPHVLIAGFLTQAIFVFFDGAAFGALPTLVGRERVGEANAAIWGFGGVLDLVVPVGTGALLALVHPADLLLIDALTFAASALLIRSIGRPMSGRRASMASFHPTQLVAEVREGLSYLWGHPGIRAMTIIGTLQSVAGAGFMALAVPYNDRILGIGTSGLRFGLVFAAWGVGGIAAAWLTPRLLRRHTTAWVTLVMIPVSGIAGVTIALLSDWRLVVAVMVVWGIAYQAVIINSISYRQQVAPEHLLGRVNTAGRMLSFGVGWTGGALVASLLAREFSVRTAMLTLVCFGLAAAAYAWAGGLRRVATRVAPPDPAA